MQSRLVQIPHSRQAVLEGQETRVCTQAVQAYQEETLAYLEVVAVPCRAAWACLVVILPEADS